MIALAHIHHHYHDEAMYWNYWTRRSSVAGAGHAVMEKEKEKEKIA